MQKLIFIIATLIGLNAFGKPLQFRWVGSQDSESRPEEILKKINLQSGNKFSIVDFKLFEERDLATSHFQYYVQVLKGTPVRGRSLRIWSDLKNKNLIQMEAQLESQENLSNLWLTFTSEGFSPRNLQAALDGQETMQIVRSELAKHADDRAIFDVKWQDEWAFETLTRKVKVKGKRGYHFIRIDLTNQDVMESRYEEFPQVDVPAMVYPIWEESETAFAPTRIPVLLKNLNSFVPAASEDPYAPLRAKRYFEDKLDPILGMDPVYQEKGIWSNVDLKMKALGILNKLPQRANDYASGMVLAGKFVTINLHPAVATKFPGIKFKPLPSAQYKPDWRVATVDGKEVGELVPGNTLLGKLVFDPKEVVERVAQRHPEHDPVTYINDGFDEVQVYWAVDTLMTALHAMGFTDPEISTRPFTAVLYDPDISMRDNAFYTDDTINFTTYSSKAQNFARDNTTIWHELGHGVMDRMMGDYIDLADTGGLSEGMADYIAQLIIQHVTEGKPYDGLEKMRIINQTGFNLTNEVHDDGEAYGGTMNDFLVKALAKYGQVNGLAKVVDLTLEAMRLSRNHPGLTAADWFNHMLFADELPSRVRSAGELKPLLIEALNGRNFAFGDQSTAKYLLLNDKEEVTDKTDGSRGKPILREIKNDAHVEYPMHVKLTSTETYKFKYPVTVRVQFEGGPIQGAIHWEGQENKAVEYKLNSEAEAVDFNLKASGTCDAVNRDDGSCVDYAYVQIFNEGDKKPVAKKRFYLRIKALP